MLTPTRIIYLASTIARGKRISSFTRDFYLRDIISITYSNRFYSIVPLGALMLFCLSLMPIIQGDWLSFVLLLVIAAALCGVFVWIILHREDATLYIHFRYPRRDVNIPLKVKQCVELISDLHSMRRDGHISGASPQAVATARSLSVGPISIPTSSTPFEHGTGGTQSPLYVGSHSQMPGESAVMISQKNITRGSWTWLHNLVGSFLIVNSLVNLVQSSKSTGDVASFVGIMLFGIVMTTVGVYTFFRENRSHELTLTTHRLIYRSETTAREKRDLSQYEKHMYIKDITQLRFSNRFHIIFLISFVFMISTIVLLLILGIFDGNMDISFLMALYITAVLGVKVFRDWKYRQERIMITIGNQNCRRWWFHDCILQVPMTLRMAEQFFNAIHILHPSFTIPCEIAAGRVGGAKSNINAEPAHDSSTASASGGTSIDMPVVHQNLGMNREVQHAYQSENIFKPADEKEKFVDEYTTVTRGRWWWVYLFLGINYVIIFVVLVVYGIVEGMSTSIAAVSVMFFILAAFQMTLGIGALFKQRRTHKVLLTSHRMQYSCKSESNGKNISYLREDFHLNDVTEIMFSNRMHAIFVLLFVFFAIQGCTSIVGMIASIGDSENVLIYVGMFANAAIFGVIVGIKVYRDAKYRLERVHIVCGNPKKTRHVRMSLQDASSLVRKFRQISLGKRNGNHHQEGGYVAPPVPREAE